MIPNEIDVGEFILAVTSERIETSQIVCAGEKRTAVQHMGGGKTFFFMNEALFTDMAEAEKFKRSLT